MKLKLVSSIALLIAATACADLDLNPLSEGSSEAWYSTETEVSMSVNDLFRDVFWPIHNDAWTDDYTNREVLTPVTNATINGEWATVNDVWSNIYKVFARANPSLHNLEKISATLPEATLRKFIGNAHYVRAAKYADLVFLFGDVVYSRDTLPLDEAFI